MFVSFHHPSSKLALWLKSGLLGVANVEVMASDFGGVVVSRGGEAIVIGVMGIAVATVGVTTGGVGVMGMIGNKGMRGLEWLLGTQLSQQAEEETKAEG